MRFSGFHRRWGRRGVFLAVGALLLGGLGSARGQDFQKDVKPFLDKYCYECHGDDLAKGDINLEAFKDDSRLFPEQRLWRNVVNQVVAGEMPPAKKKVRPTQAETEALQKNIRGLLTRAQARTKVDPGTVTIRRLNRVEYNNTIRDLCLIEGDFSADFPADDTGYGFDNIGDVLSFSPVHLERYIAVGAQVAAKAMPTKESELDVVTINMPSLLPPGRYEGQNRFFQPSRTMTGVFTAPRAGEYIVRTRLGAEGDKNEPPAEVGVFVDGALVQKFRLKFTPVRRTELIEAKVNLKAGPHPVTLTWLNPPADPASPLTVVGQRLSLVGPTDTRTELQRRLAKVIEGRRPEERGLLLANWFVSRAFRRPATTAELQRYIRVYEEGFRTGGTWEAGMQAMMSVVLASPKFVFRAEQDDQPTLADAHPITDFALASRLSYFLWGSMPDEELFALASQRRLAPNLEAQARRLLKDPRAQHLATGFGLQWLQLRRLATVSPDPRKFPDFSEPLRGSMMRETELFFWEIVREDRKVTDLLDADFTYVDRALSRFYGLRGVPFTGGQGEFVRVRLPAGADRGGVLTQASILTATSNPDRTSPVKRGKWILEQILGTPPPPAPAEIPSLESQGALKGTLRQRMEQHRANPACASCHTRMDAIGFAFEKFDAIGQSRLTDEGLPIESSGRLPDGRSFSGTAQLKALLLADREQFIRSLSSNLLTFGLGRGLEFYDEPAVDRLVAETLKGDQRFSALVLAVVRSDPFRLRRGTSQSEPVSNPPAPRK